MAVVSEVQERGGVDVGHRRRRETPRSLTRAIRPLGGGGMAPAAASRRLDDGTASPASPLLASVPSRSRKVTAFGVWIEQVAIAVERAQYQATFFYRRFERFPRARVIQQRVEIDVRRR